MTTQATETETSDAVRVARETLAHTSTATATLPEMSRVELCTLIGRLQGSLLGLVQYVHLTQQIARHEQSTRETQARIDARTSMPNGFDLIAAIKDMHSGSDGTCPECKQPHPCRTYAHVDGLLAARFDDTPAKTCGNRADRLHARVIELTELLNDSTRLTEHMARLREYHAITDGQRTAVVQAKHLSCQGLQRVDPDQPIHGGVPVEGFHEELKRRGEGHVYGCELIGCSGADGGTR